MKASEVLAKSIADIQDGKWICGTLDDNKGPNNHMGCAIGLVAIHSGHVRDSDFQPGLKEAMYLTDSKPPKSAVIAAEYLVKALGEEKKISSKADRINTIEEIVVGHNDNACKTPAVAEKWFKDALMLAELDGN